MGQFKGVSQNRESINLTFYSFNAVFVKKFDASQEQQNFRHGWKCVDQKEHRLKLEQAHLIGDEDGPAEVGGKDPEFVIFGDSRMKRLAIGALNPVAGVGTFVAAVDVPPENAVQI